MRHKFTKVLLSCLATVGLAQAESIKWDSSFPAVPDKHGFAGPFAGVVGEESDRHLIFGGGANFPQGAPWEKDAAGNKAPKVWYSSLYAIKLQEDNLQANGEWSKLTVTLPEKLGYGASVSLADRNSTLFIGGHATRQKMTT